MYVIVFISGCVSGYVVVGVCRCLWSSLVVSVVMSLVAFVASGHLLRCLWLCLWPSMDICSRVCV